MAINMSAAAPAMTPEILKKQHKKMRQKAARTSRHAALAARIESDRNPTKKVELDAGRVAIAVPAEVEAGSAGDLPPSARACSSTGSSNRAESEAGAAAIAVPAEADATLPQRAPGPSGGITSYAGFLLTPPAPVPAREAQGPRADSGPMLQTKKGGSGRFRLQLQTKKF